jgi:hypothetical protein
MELKSGADESASLRRVAMRDFRAGGPLALIA